MTSLPSYTARVDNGRVIVDVTDADVDPSIGAITSKVGVVGGVLTQTAESGGKPLTRVSIALTKDSTYRVRVDGNTLRMVSLVFPPRSSNVTVTRNCTGSTSSPPPWRYTSRSGFTISSNVIRFW